MKFVFDHNSESDDEKFLLDDENTNKCSSCSQYEDEKSSGDDFSKSDLRKNKPFGWLEIKNGTMSNHYVPINCIIEEDTPSCTYENSNLPLTRNGHLDSNSLGKKDFHCHSDSVEYNDSSAWKRLIFVSLICTVLMITELVGGSIAGSLAIMTDAAHLLSDLIGFLVSIISMWLSRKLPNRTMTFGYYRSEILGAFLSILTVWLLAGIFCYLAIHRLLRKEYDIDASTMLVVASIGVVINIVMAAVLHGFCHGHTHSHGNLISNNKENINVRAAAAHVIGDLCQSLGVLVAAIIIKIYPQAQAADPICTLLFSIVAIYATLRIVRDVAKILLEASPENVGDIMDLLKNIPGVNHVHEIHLWTLAPGREVFNVHLAVEKHCDREAVLQQASNLISIRTSIISCTVQIETYNPDIITDCNRCQLLDSIH